MEGYLDKTWDVEKSGVAKYRQVADKEQQGTMQGPWVLKY